MIDFQANKTKRRNMFKENIKVFQENIMIFKENMKWLVLSLIPLPNPAFNLQ